MTENNILVIGDVMLDHYLWGAADRISPEAPVPVVKIDRETFGLGGAANVANNLVALGANTTLLGVVGEDENSQRIGALLLENNISDACIRADIPTTTKLRVVSQRHQMIRLDWEENYSGTSKPLQKFKELTQQHSFALILISDYNKGFCSPTLLSEILKYSMQQNTPALIDPKGKDWQKYRGAFLIKPNLIELEEIAGHSIPNENDPIEKVANKLIEKYDFNYLLITRGDKGLSIVGKNMIHHMDALAVDVFDVSGAGDTVIAHLAFDLQKGVSIKEACVNANRAASEVIKKFGVAVLEK